VSLLTYYRVPGEKRGEVYFRVKGLSAEAVAAIQAELASRFEIIYVIPEGGP
jgi:hypothetical protein